MKKMLIVLFVMTMMVMSFADNYEKAIYLERLLSENGSTRTAMEIPATRGINYGFKLSISEQFVNKVLKEKVQLEALKSLNLYFRDNKFVIDGTFYFDLLDLDIPFTATGDVVLLKDNQIALNAREMKIWSEGNLPTAKILGKVINYINESKALENYVKISFESIPTRYDAYGRIILNVQMRTISPALNLNITNIGLGNELISVYGK